MFLRVFLRVVYVFLFDIFVELAHADRGGSWLMSQEISELKTLPYQSEGSRSGRRSSLAEALAEVKSVGYNLFKSASKSSIEEVSTYEPFRELLSIDLTGFIIRLACSWTYHII